MFSIEFFHRTEKLSVARYTPVWFLLKQVESEPCFRTTTRDSKCFVTAADRAGVSLGGKHRDGTGNGIEHLGKH